ncbi:MAG: hypothetical protein KDJ77_18515, partial [Rhodobiaceae bacterium]|nr:hypothetical protein [Rhodobiaceae bacterium]
GQSPARIPDLFAGGSVGVLARYTDGGTHRITVIGLVNGRPASMPLDVTLAAKPEDGQASGDSALPLVWAREQIFDKTRQYTISGGADTALREAITQLGLAFSLQTDFTSFVAVSERVYNETPGATPSADVPLPQAAGVPTSAYPTLNVSGSSAPEPGTIFAMVAAVLMVLARFWRRILATLGLRIGRTRSEPRLEGLPKRLLNDGWWLQ